MDVLNLDDLSKQTRTISLAGHTHEVIDMTVEDFIETTKAIEKMKKMKEADEVVSEAEQIIQVVEMISRRVPTLAPEELKKLSMVKLSTIMKFIQGDFDEEAKTEEKEEKKGKGAKVGKK